MKKTLVLPICLIVTGLITVGFSLYRGFQTISKSETARIASEYAVTKLQDYRQNDGSIEEMVLTNDLSLLLSEKRQWIVKIADIWAWIHIDAENGKIVDVEKDFKEYTTPTSLPLYNNFTSYLANCSLWRIDCLLPLIWKGEEI